MQRVLYPILGLLVLLATVAQVRATRSQAPPASAAPTRPVTHVVAEGRVVAYPGQDVVVGTELAGTIETVAVEERQAVRKGDVVARIKAHDLRAALGEAEARVREGDADIRLFESEVARAKSLYQQDVGTRQGWEKAERDLDAARARRASAAAEVRRLAAVVEKTVIRAPIDGVIVDREADAGESVAAGDPLVTIANLDRIRVEAEVDEFDAARVRNGAPASVNAEGYETGWQGTVEEIPDAVVNRRIKPQDPGKPIDTRVLLVKIALPEPTPLKLGQRVEVSIGR